jgi:hypothetical protein
MTDYNRIHRERQGAINDSKRDTYLAVADVIDEVLDKALKEPWPPQLVPTLGRIANTLREKAWNDELE